MNDAATEALAAFDAAISEATDTQTPFVALQKLAQALVPAKLFTVSVTDYEAEVSRRAHTSHPVDYPASGTKPFNRTHWTEIVHGEKRPFVANSIEEIAGVFFDHEQIKALGCESVVNLPVILGGQIVGTVNMLDRAGAYPPAMVARIQQTLSLPAKLAMLVWRRNGGTV